MWPRNNGFFVANLVDGNPLRVINLLAENPSIFTDPILTPRNVKWISADMVQVRPIKRAANCSILYGLRRLMLKLPTFESHFDWTRYNPLTWVENCGTAPDVVILPHTSTSTCRFGTLTDSYGSRFKEGGIYELLGGPQILPTELRRLVNAIKYNFCR